MNKRYIISGGQSGADLAGLMAAKVNGYSTGGSIVKHFMTEDGVRPEYKYMFGLKELDSTNYILRTKHNLLHSDCTILFYKFLSGGSKITKQLCEEHKKPLLFINIEETDRVAAVMKIRDFLKKNNPLVINIAGHRESKCEGIYDYTYKVMKLVLNNIRWEN